MCARHFATRKYVELRFYFLVLIQRTGPNTNGGWARFIRGKELRPAIRTKCLCEYVSAVYDMIKCLHITADIKIIFFHEDQSRKGGATRLPAIRTVKISLHDNFTLSGKFHLRVQALAR